MITQAVKEQEEWVVFQQRLRERGLEGCIFCWSRGLEDRSHPGTQCHRILDMDKRRREAYSVAVAMDRFLRRGSVEERFACYLSCFVPHELCDAWGEDLVEGGWQKIQGRKCQYEGVTVSTIAYVGTCIPEDAAVLYEKLGFEGGLIEEKVEVWR